MQPEGVKIAMVAALLAPAAAVAAARLGVGAHGSSGADVAASAATRGESHGYEFDAWALEPLVRGAADSEGEQSGGSRLEVSSIVGGRQPLAVIDGQTLKVGDEASDGWIVVEIDSAGWTVTVEKDAERMQLPLKPE